MEPDSKEEPKKPIQKKSALISSEIIAPLINGDTEVFFHGAQESDLNTFEFEDAKEEGVQHANKKVFIFKSKDAGEAMRWVERLGDSLASEEVDVSELSGNAIFISDDKKKVEFKMKSRALEPVIIIDGKEMEAGFDIDSIDTDTIESINILKGQKALQKVGEKGLNGVIVIKMKK